MKATLLGLGACALLFCGCSHSESVSATDPPQQTRMATLQLAGPEGSVVVVQEDGTGASKTVRVRKLEGAGPDGPRHVRVLRSEAGKAPEGGEVRAVQNAAPGQRKTTAARRIGVPMPPIQDRNAPKAYPGGPGIAPAYKRLAESCGKCDNAACKEAVACAKQCAEPRKDAAESSACRLQCLQACAKAAAECESCRKAMAGCLSACAQRFSGGGMAALQLDGATLKLDDLACEGGACAIAIECDDCTLTDAAAGECEVICEIVDVEGNKVDSPVKVEVTVNGKPVTPQGAMPRVRMSRTLSGARPGSVQGAQNADRIVELKKFAGAARENAGGVAGAKARADGLRQAIKALSERLDAAEKAVIEAEAAAKKAAENKDAEKKDG